MFSKVPSGTALNRSAVLQDADCYSRCIAHGDSAVVTHATKESPQVGAGLCNTMTFNEFERKVEKLCSLCQQKFNRGSMHTQVTKKRIIEWRKKRGIHMKNASPFVVYDYVPVCTFCSQFFTTTKTKFTNSSIKVDHQPLAQSKIPPIEFSEDQKCSPSLPTSIFSQFFSAT